MWKAAILQKRKLYQTTDYHEQTMSHPTPTGSQTGQLCHADLIYQSKRRMPIATLHYRSFKAPKFPHANSQVYKSRKFKSDYRINMFRARPHTELCSALLCCQMYANSGTEALLQALVVRWQMGPTVKSRSIASPAHWR